jgi:chemotaxis family two-component system response regulator Rcp1
MPFESSNFDVLLVEKSPADARLIKEVFNRYQIRNNIFHVSDSENALKYLNKKGKYKNIKNPSLILMNFNLPKIDGGKLLKIIKEDKNLKIIPVIMIIDSAYEKEINYSYRNGANAVIVKPDDWEGFEELINSLEDFWVNKTKLPNMRYK